MDKVDEWISKGERVQAKLRKQFPDSISETEIIVSKLLTLVRVYREANQFYAKRKHYGNPPDFECSELGELARAAEEKAKEIVG